MLRLFGLASDRRAASAAGASARRSKVHPEQLIDDDGVYDGAALTKVMTDGGLDAAGVCYQTIAVMGPQGSGKSTGMNEVFGTTFVARDPRGEPSQTTRGIWLACSSKATGFPTLVMDLEGADGTERTDNPSFAKMIAAFGLADASVLVINLWAKDVGRGDGACMPLLQTIFQTNLKLFPPAAGRRRPRLLFLFRDQGVTPLELLQKRWSADLQALWTRMPKPAELDDSRVDDYFEVEYASLASFETNKKEFRSAARLLRARFNPKAVNSLVGLEERRLPASALVVKYQTNLPWVQQKDIVDDIMPVAAPVKLWVASAVVCAPYPAGDKKPGNRKSTQLLLREQLWHLTELLASLAVSDATSELFVPSGHQRRDHHAEASARADNSRRRAPEQAHPWGTAPRRRTGKGRRSRSPAWSMHAPTSEGQQMECRLAVERACERHRWEVKNINAACLVLDFQPPAGWSPMDAARALAADMGDTNVSGTLSCTGADGRREVLTWAAGSTEIIRSAFPAEAEGWQINGVYVEDDGCVMLAVTRGEDDIRAVQTKLEASDEDTAEARGAADAMGRLSIQEAQLPGRLRLRARIKEKHAMQQIRPVVKEQLPDGGCCADISEAVHAWDDDTQLQLTWRNIIVDRYNLSAADIADLRTDVADIKSESDVIVHSALLASSKHTTP